jgi:hypothetical protein
MNNDSARSFPLDTWKTANEIIHHTLIKKSPCFPISTKTIQSMVQPLQAQFSHPPCTILVRMYLPMLAVSYATEKGIIKLLPSHKWVSNKTHYHVRMMQHKRNIQEFLLLQHTDCNLLQWLSDDQGGGLSLRAPSLQMKTSRLKGLLDVIFV